MFNYNVVFNFITLLQIPLNKLSANKVKKEQRTVVPFLIGCGSGHFLLLFAKQFFFGLSLKRQFVVTRKNYRAFA